jgi:hypothetical protein
MRYNAKSWIITAVAVVALASINAGAQTQKGPDAKLPCVGCSVDGKTTPRTSDGHPDLNGFWNTPQRENSGRQVQKDADGSILYEFAVDFDETIPEELCLDDSCQLKNQPPYKPEYMPKVKEVADTMYLGTSSLDPELSCKPYGVPRTGIGAMQVVETPQVIALLYEGAPNSIYRIIYMDERPVPEDLDPSYMGYSTGHWEGDTLVVDVTGFNDETWLGNTAHGRAKYTSIHSDQMHVTERWTRQGNTLTVETTVQDPVMFTKPWVLAPRRVQMSTPGDYIHEAICSQVNMSGVHMIKPTETDKGQLFNGSKANALEK